MRLYLTTLSLVVALVLLFVPVAESATDRVSEAGERLRITPSVRYTTDGVKSSLLNSDKTEAKELYERALLSDSTYAPARYSLAKLLLYSKADSAMINARAAYESDTTNRWYLDLYAQSLVGVQDYHAAAECYEQLIKLKPRDINSYRILAILYSRSDRIYEAIAVLDTAELRAGRHSYLTALKRQFLISTDQFGRALHEAQLLVDEEPYSAENRVAMAELYVAAKRDSMAMAEFGVAMRIDSTRLETQLPYGDYLRSTGRESEYLDVMRLVMQSEDLQIADKILLVRELVEDDKLYRREYLRIGDLIRSLLIQSPSDTTLVDLQVKHLISMGMVEQAVEYLKGHLHDGAPRLNQFRMVVSMERHLNRPDSVDHYLLYASHLFPEESSLRYERAYILTTQKRYDKAIECYQAEMKGAIDSLKSSVVGIIGDIYYQMALESREEGDFKSAKRELKKSFKSYEEALKLDSNNALVLNNYAYFLSENGGDLNRAYDMSKRSNDLESSNPTYLDTYAWVLYRMGRFTEAKVVMRQAISFDRSENGEIAMHYGEILWVLGEVTMANFYWDKALSWGMSEEQISESRERAQEMMEMKTIEGTNDGK